MDILTYLLTAPLARGVVEPATCPFTSFVDRSLWAGVHADRVAYAFVGAYSAALAQLVAGLPSARPFPTRMCMAATEKGGGHPKAIETRLTDLTLNGEKTFATQASAAEELLVVASRGEDESGQNRLAIVRVSAKAPGVTITNKPEMAFAPELSHAIVRLENVKVAEADVLPGDGYSTYLKPFRTIEDTQVLAATLGYAIGVVRTYALDTGLLSELLAHGELVVTLGARPPADPLTHVLLAGAFAGARRLTIALSAAFTAKDDSEERARWERDQPMLGVAGNVRAQRTASAFKTLGF